MTKRNRRNPPVQPSLSHAQARVLLKVLDAALMSCDIGNNFHGLTTTERNRLSEAEHKLSHATNMATVHPEGGK
jgi:hypothetical protein